jgi:arylformamidase
LSARRLYIDLTPDEAHRFSPIWHVNDIACPVDLVYGGRESPEFVRQGHAFATALARSKHRSSVESFADLNHFEMAVQFGRPDSVIHGKAMAQIRALSNPAFHTN